VSQLATSLVSVLIYAADNLAHRFKLFYFDDSLNCRFKLFYFDKTMSLSAPRLTKCQQEQTEILVHTH
jgi:hypothetical protein